MAKAGYKFECLICLQTFKQPKLLPCSHTFCAGCLQSHIDAKSSGNRFVCPLCRKNIDIPEHGISEFPANYYILPTLVVNNENKCIPCDCCSVENGGLFMCLQCDEYYCKTCTDQHRKLKATRDHKILEHDPEHGQTGTRIRRKTFCPVHNEEIAFVCDCKMQICLHCKLTAHLNHKSESIVEIAGEIKKQIKEILLSDRLQHAKSKTTSMTQTCSRMKRKLDELKERELEKIEKRRMKLKTQIDEICDELKTKVTNNVDARRKSIEEEEELANACMESTEHLCFTSERMLKMADDIDIIDQGRTLYENLTDCFTDKDHPEVSLPYIEFKEKDLRIDELRSYYGDVIIIETPSLVSSFVLDERTNIYGLCPVDDKTCWVANRSCKLSLVDLKGKVMKQVTFNTEIDQVISDTDGSLFISSYNNKYIQKYTTQEQIVDVCSLQFHPVNMALNHVTDELIVNSHTGIYTVLRDGSVNIVKFKDTVFKKAFGVDIDETGILCVSDWESQVVTFFYYKGGNKSPYTRTNRTFKLYLRHLFVYEVKKKSTYNGNDSNFSPHEVCCDYIGNYYVVDKLAKLIHVLRSDGSLVYNFSTEENLPEPVSVVIHGCHLWVGHDNGHISVYDMSH